VSAADLFKVDPPDRWAWPVSYRYHIDTPWGETTQELTVDVPIFAGDATSSQNLGLELWRRGVAVATTRHVALVVWETVVWRELPFPIVKPAGDVRGLLSGAASAQVDTPVVVFHTDHGDDLARRRFFLSGAPAAWVQDGLVTLGGRDAMEAWGIMMGCMMSGDLTGAPCTQLLMYPGLLPPEIGNVTGVAFRRVRRYRGFHHTAKAPDEPLGPWPS
jgi:hypothetical protein